MRKKIKGLKKEMGGDGSGCKGLVGDGGQRCVYIYIYGAFLLFTLVSIQNLFNYEQLNETQNEVHV